MQAALRLLASGPSLQPLDVNHTMATIDPRAVLLDGAEILTQTLAPHGFSFVQGPIGKGSGGHFASGDFVRGDRRLELHFRYGLGLVKYHLGDVSIDHETYLRSLGKWPERRYLDFSSEPLESFRALAHDLTRFCSDFLSGPGTEFKAFAAAYASNPNRFKGFGVLRRP